jgi:CheY-like chemotaxis protein
MKTIFLAEDNPHDTGFFRNALEEMQQQFVVLDLKDGQELMDKLHSSETAPDIIFLDINMPRKSGYEALQEIRSSEKFNQLPVIIFSGDESPFEIQRMHIAGASLFVRKPDNIYQWKETISRALSIVFTSGVRQFPIEQFVVR